MNFTNKKLKEFRNINGLLIDVRSPEEYYKGHMPNSINIPLFNNEERAIVGKRYKYSGREIAVKEGFKIIDKKIDILIQDFFSVIDEYLKNNERKIPREQIKMRIYCARGGMRSQSISWLLEKFNFTCITLDGGYKLYRNWVLSNFKEKQNIIVIGGKTGVGKTKILNKLEALNYQILDFESLANHRGSSFGGLGMLKQPTNEQYENMIAEKLINYNSNNITFVEAESPNIGKNRIPFELYEQMKISPRIEIKRAEKIRINELINTYSSFSKDDLKESVLRISKRLGPQRTKSALDSIELENWEGVCKSVLEYYDKCYEYDLKNKLNVKILKMDFKNDDEIIKQIISSLKR